jgi:ADP-heptose:LPS heptosyltransferase
MIWRVLKLIFSRNNIRPKTSPENILFIRFAALGDVLQTTPALAAARRKWSGARIDYLVYKSSAHALDNNPDVNGIIIGDKGGKLGPRNPVHIMKMAVKLRASRYDLAVCLGSNPTAGILARMAGIKYIAGLIYDKRKGIFLDEYEIVGYDDKRPRQKTYADLLNKIGIPMDEHERPVLKWNSDDKKLIDGLVKDSGTPFIAIFGGGGINEWRPWAGRKWDTAKWQELIARINMHLKGKCTFILLGTDVERNLNEGIKGTDIPTLDLTGKTSFSQLGYLLSLCKLLITTDSSPVFAASAVGCPSIVLYGPEWTERSHPLGGGEWHPVTVEAECRDFCCTFPDKPPVCINECMTGITVDMVYEQMQKVLAK